MPQNETDHKKKMKIWDKIFTAIWATINATNAKGVA